MNNKKILNCFLLAIVIQIITSTYAHRLQISPRLLQNANNSQIINKQQVTNTAVSPNLVYPLKNVIVSTHKLTISKNRMTKINGQITNNKTTTIYQNNNQFVMNPRSVAMEQQARQIQRQALIQQQKQQQMNKKQQQLRRQRNKNNGGIPFYCSTVRATQVPGNANAANSRQFLTSTNYGFNMYVDSLDGTVSNMIRASGTWEPNYINLIGHIVKPGDNVMNLGSQSGLQALVMGKIVGNKGRLFIFQPYSFSNKLVTKNIQLNKLSNITTIYKVGASDEKTTAEISIVYWNTGGSEITPLSRPKNVQNNTNVNKSLPVGPTVPQPIYNFDMPNNQREEVQIDLVDSLLPQDVKLNFALLDVQKMEIKALMGMKKVIERSPQLVIMTQWQYGQNPRRNQQQTMGFLQWMTARGYKIYSYVGGNIHKCQLGYFRQYKNPRQLLVINFIDIFFFPSTVPLP